MRPQLLADRKEWQDLGVAFLTDFFFDDFADFLGVRQDGSDLV